MKTKPYQITSANYIANRYDVFGRLHKRFGFEFTFSSRDEYLAFVREWKRDYAELTQLIRQAKLAFRRRHRVEGGMEAWREEWARLEAYCDAHHLVGLRVEDEVLNWPLKAHARFLLQLRKNAKQSIQATIA
ncbi:MAG: hypothetical protein AAF585_20380 [Verrucomicrobiota bacterium]